MHVLIIEGFRSGHETLKKFGCEISMIIEKFRISGNEDGFYNRFFVVEDNADIDEWIEVAKKINSISKIDVIINFHENRQIETFHIASALNLSYHNLLECTLCKDKVRMRNFFNEKKIDNVKSGTLDDLKIEINNKTVKFPIIIKPRFGWGSKFIKKVVDCTDLGFVLEEINTINSGVEFCFEEFIDGVEYSVESFSQNGIHKIVAITEKKKDFNFIETGHILPANISTKIKNMINQKIIFFLEAIDHKNGPMHTEIIINDDVYIVESHLRMGGDKIPELIEFQSGFNLLNCWCESIMGKNVIDSVPELDYKSHRTHINFIHASNFAHGKIFEKIKINKKIMPFLKEQVAYLKKGDLIPLTVDSFSRIGHYIYTCSDKDHLNLENIDAEKFIVFK